MFGRPEGTVESRLIAICAAFGLCVALAVFCLFASSKGAFGETSGQWWQREAAAAKQHLLAEHPDARNISCQTEEPFVAPRCEFTEGREYMAIFKIGSRETGTSTQLTSVEIVSLKPWAPVPAFRPSISGETQESYEQHREEVVQYEYEHT